MGIVINNITALMIMHHLNGIDKTQRFPDTYLAAKTGDVISAANKNLHWLAAIFRHYL
jgi:hypothetical protein